MHAILLFTGKLIFRRCAQDWNKDRRKRSGIVTTVCLIREEARTVMRFFLTYAYRYKAPLVRDPRAGRTRCSRIRVFVDRANDCRCIYIFKTTFTVSPAHTFPTKDLRAEMLQDIWDIPKVIFLDHCSKHQAKQNAC